MVHSSATTSQLSNLKRLLFSLLMMEVCGEKKFVLKTEKCSLS